jgi:hypothetical protein
MNYKSTTTVCTSDERGLEPKPYSCPKQHSTATVVVK